MTSVRLAFLLLAMSQMLSSGCGPPPPSPTSVESLVRAQADTREKQVEELVARLSAEKVPFDEAFYRAMQTESDFRLLFGNGFKEEPEPGHYLSQSEGLFSSEEFKQYLTALSSVARPAEHSLLLKSLCQRHGGLVRLDMMGKWHLSPETADDYFVRLFVVSMACKPASHLKVLARAASAPPGPIEGITRKVLEHAQIDSTDCAADLTLERVSADGAYLTLKSRSGLFCDIPEKADAYDLMALSSTRLLFGKALQLGLWTQPKPDPKIKKLLQPYQRTARQSQIPWAVKDLSSLEVFCEADNREKKLANKSKQFLAFFDKLSLYVEQRRLELEKVAKKFPQMTVIDEFKTARQAAEQEAELYGSTGMVKAILTSDGLRFSLNSESYHSSSLTPQELFEKLDDLQIVLDIRRTARKGRR